MGVNGLSIGIESGDDAALALAEKVIRRMIFWSSARLFSGLNPYFISVDALTLFADTKLYEMAQTGYFIAGGEKEKLREDFYGWKPGRRLMEHPICGPVRYFICSVSFFLMNRYTLPLKEASPSSTFSYILRLLFDPVLP